MSVVVSDKTKARIKKYVEEGNVPYLYKQLVEQAMQELENTNQLSELVSEVILESIYRDAKSTRDMASATKEFEARLAQAFEDFDSIPKSTEYDAFELRGLSEEQKLKSVESCFGLLDLHEEMLDMRDARKIAKETMTSIEFIKENGIALDEETVKQLSEVSSSLDSLLESETTDISALQSQIDAYNESAVKIWMDFLAEPTDGTEKENYLVHNFTRGTIETPFRTKYMSTSLHTSNAMGVYGSSGYGYIIKPKGIVIANSIDTHTVNNAKDESRVTIVRQPIKLPQQVEAEMIETCVQVNGEILNSDVASIYSEVVVKDYEIVGIFLITCGEKEMHPQYNEAVELANKMGVAFEDKNLAQKREAKGLQPLTTKMKKELCSRVLYTYSQNSEYGVSEGQYERFASEFTEKNYEEFATRFLTLRSDDYTAQDIEKAFRTMILDNTAKSPNGIEFWDSEHIICADEPFLDRVTEEDIKYIVSKRYDLTKCETVEEFKQKYAEFKEVVVNGRFDDKTKECFAKVFGDYEKLRDVELSDEEQERIFNSEDKSVGTIMEYIAERDKQVEVVETELKSELEAVTVQVEEIIEDTETVITQPETQDNSIEEAEQPIAIEYTNDVGDGIGQTEEQVVTKEQENEIVPVSGRSTELTFMQKIATRISANRFLSKLSFMKRFVEKQLSGLPESPMSHQAVEISNDTDGDKFKATLNNLTNKDVVDYASIENPKKEVNEIEQIQVVE